ncbi:MAG: hypothetical protein JSS82_08245 [Bacteroidetes bacterium]|nr:hypothetical protein [Bacteroidota bacterium]
MKQIFRAAMPCLAVLLMASCSKKDKNTNPGNTTPDPLANLTTYEKEVVGTWRFERKTDTTLDMQNNYVSSSGYTNPCSQDDIFTFRSDKKYTKNEGADTCTANELYDEKSWSIDSDGTFHYAHSPSPWAFNNAKYYRIDATHFMVQANTIMINTIDRLTYYYVKTQ